VNIGVAIKIWKLGVCTTILILALLKIIVEHQVLDALLFLPLGLLLILHSNSKGRI
jgi:hypothetical protein